MNLNIKLSLRPLQPAIWKKDEETGAEFLVGALPSALDNQLADEVIAEHGSLDGLAFAYKVAPHIIRDWRHIGDGGAAAPVNAETIKLFVEHHGNSKMPKIIRWARSIDHYVQKEADEAKKD